MKKMDLNMEDLELILLLFEHMHLSSEMCENTNRSRLCKQFLCNIFFLGGGGVSDVKTYYTTQNFRETEFYRMGTETNN